MRPHLWRFIFVTLLLGATGLFLHHPYVSSPRLQKPLSDLPKSFSTWEMQQEDSLDDGVLSILRPTAYLHRLYADEDGSIVRLYIGYHDGGAESGEIHSPQHCLPGGGWQLIRSSKVLLQDKGISFPAIFALYEKDGHREFFLYWYQCGDKILSSDFSLKLTQFDNALRLHRRDAAFIRISVQDRDNDPDLAETVASRFANDLLPFLKEIFPP